MARQSTREKNPFNRACKRLMELAERVYADNLGRRNACLMVISEAGRTVESESYDPSSYDPYRELISRIQRDFPELWAGDQRNSAQKILARWTR
jgi:hypothetical protein